MGRPRRRRRLVCGWVWLAVEPGSLKRWPCPGGFGVRLPRRNWRPGGAPTWRPLPLLLMGAMPSESRRRRSARFLCRCAAPLRHGRCTLMTPHRMPPLRSLTPPSSTASRPYRGAAALALAAPRFAQSRLPPAWCLASRGVVASGAGEGAPCPRTTERVRAASVRFGVWLSCLCRRARSPRKGKSWSGGTAGRPARTSPTGR